MQTSFSPERLADPDIGEANAILRACVHCGFCNATCPTFALIGDELDGPRGRIYLMKAMFEADRPASPTDVLHIDRCLSCLSCMTTCPSGVHYMHLVDQARVHIEETYDRPAADRLLRGVLGRVLPHPGRFRLALGLARAARPLAAPLARWLPAAVRRLLAMAPARSPAAAAPRGRVYPAEGARRYRVALLAGCVQDVLAPDIDRATVRLLTRHGCEVVVAPGSRCCGALNHHLGQAARARALIAANLRAWAAEIAGEGLDAVVINASGCGTMVKDYGYLLRADPALSGLAAEVSAKTRDISEFIAEIGLADVGAPPAPGLRVVYQPPCSLQHGQRVIDQPGRLLDACKYDVLGHPEAHICCGSAGTYNILQSGLADRLRARKAANLAAVPADAVATGNIGCMMQLAPALSIPVVHVVELLDWATGGPRPAALKAYKSG